MNLLKKPISRIRINGEMRKAAIRSSRAFLPEMKKFTWHSGQIMAVQARFAL